MIPQQILAEVVRQQQLMGWPEFVPGYAIWPHADGEEYIKRYDELTIGDCEQLVEHHHRKALKAIETWKKTLSRNSLSRAGKNIVYARLYRCRYLQLIGKTDSTEADMPLPLVADRGGQP